MSFWKWLYVTSAIFSTAVLFALPLVVNACQHCKG